MERLNYEKILFENLSEGAFAMITKSEKDFADWIESIKYQSKRCDELYSELKKYKDAEEQGLLHKAPLKDGTPIWHLTEGFDEGAYLTETHYIYNVTEYEIGELGKDFWLSEEEAELELSNRQQSHAETIMDERNGR